MQYFGRIFVVLLLFLIKNSAAKAAEFRNYHQYKKTIGTQAQPKNTWQGIDGHWLISDRKHETQRFANANIYNLKLNNGYVQYKNLPQRAALYAWLQKNQYKNNRSQWCGVAYTTVKKLDLALTPAAKAAGVSSRTISHFIRTGNKIILDDVWTDLQKLHQSGIKNAYVFDAALLYREQVLIQKYYLELSPENIKRLEKTIKKQSALFKIILKNDAALEGNLLDITHRWAYGMQSMGYVVQATDAPVAGYKK